MWAAWDKPDLVGGSKVTSKSGSSLHDLRVSLGVSLFMNF